MRAPGSPAERLNRHAFARPVLVLARELLGCVVRHGDAAGVIVETEAYHQSEPACHAFVGVTPRTRVLYGSPGRAYVYRSYGIHSMLNVVCESEGVGAAVLIRALEPIAGLAAMRDRRPRARADDDLCNGPGKLCEALGIGLGLNDTSLIDGPIAIEPRAGAPAWEAGVRIGITKAAELEWRFCALGSPWVSRPLPPAVVRLRALSRRRNGARTPARRRCA